MAAVSTRSWAKTGCYSSMSDEVSLCTFAIGDKNLIQQAIYACETCGTNEDACCCAACSKICHNGHDVSFVAFGPAFCDCGHNGCSLIGPSMDAAAKLLQANNGQDYYKYGLLGNAKPGQVPSFNVQEICGLDALLTTSLQDQCAALVTKSKETFWLGMNDNPRCELEELAKIVFQRHIDCVRESNLKINELNTGSEWWVQVRHNDNDNVKNSGGVELHYDKDEEIASLFGIGIYPLISTVTYLTSHVPTCAAAPTVVFEATASKPIYDAIKKCYISIPEIGKHVSFNGRFLHGAPAQLKKIATLNYCSNDQLINECKHFNNNNKSELSDSTNTVE